jgi:cell division septation protein DedD
METTNHSTPFDLPLMSAGLNLGELDLRGGEGFWEEVERFSNQSTLGAQLDEAIAGRAAPRVWVILGAEAPAAGLVVARLLADRGQAVVLLDADEADPRLTLWTGRHEQEGWIDMIRYGASRTTASDTLPSTGRRGAVIGVGSFMPTGATPEEIGDLVARLRRQGDDLIIVAPAEPAAAPWCRTADIRLLAWDRLGREEDEVRALVATLRESGIILEGLVGFGVEEWEALQKLTPLEDLVLAPPAPGGPVINAPEPEVEPVREPEAVTAAPRKTSSGVLRFAAVVGGLAVLAVGYFVINANRGPSAPPRRVAVSQPARDTASADLATRLPDAATALVPAAGESAEVTQAQPPAQAVESPARTAEPPAPPVEVRPLPAGFDLAPYRAPVGQAGWALWIYSQPNQDAADRDVVGLQKQGFQATSRAVDLPEKGRWYRIYVGSFPSKEAAQQAAPALLAHLKHDWAAPARF